MANSIKMTIAKNGVKMYFLDGKRISRDKAIEISKNADNEMLTNALGANIALKEAQAILIIETKDPLEVGKYREFGWFFANVDDAVNAAKKVAALFGDRFTGARIMGDAEHFDNRTIATVDKAGNVEIKKQIPTYIFTTYQTVTGVNCNGRTEHTDTFATYCKELGDDDNFTGLYREVTFFDENRLSGWSIKTADGKFIAKGNTEAELKKAYENIKAGNVEVSEEIAEINAADVKVNVADNGKVIEQIKVDVDTAIKIINRLNYRNDTFVYSNTTRYDNADIKCRHFDAYKADGEKDAFAITEYVINGKLEIVRFANLYRDIIVHLQIGNVNYTIGDKGAIVLTDAEEIVDKTRFLVHMKYFSYEDGFIARGGFEKSFATAEDAAKWILDVTTNRPYDTFTKETVIYDGANLMKEYYLTDADLQIINSRLAELDGSEEDIDGDNVFDYLPALDELNDVDIDDDAPEAFNADVASGNYSLDINDEYVRFENHSIVRIDAMRKMNWIYDHTGKNKIFRYGNRKSSAAKVIDMYMNGERAKEQDEYFREFFIPYNKARGTIEVWVILTYADDREHHFRAEFNQGRLADKFIADVKELAGDTPCQIFKKYRNNYVKPVWEDPHKYETVGNLEHARHLYCEETSGDIAPEEYPVTQEAFDEAIEAEEFEALFAKWTAEILSDPRIEAAYRKARERVEVEFTSYGAPLYTYIKKNGERCYEDFVAKSYITKCGLQETDFIVKARAEAKITRDRRTEKIGDDEVYYVGGKWQCTYSAKYHASFFRGINSGELMYRVDDLTIVSEQDFWQAMIERGGCSIDNDVTVAEELTAKLREVTRKSRLMDIYPQIGTRIVDPLYKVEIRPDSDGFIFTNGHETLARYDTKEQCLDVIERIKTAIEGYDTEFEFPMAADVELELKLPALIVKQFDKYRYRSKGRKIPRRFLAAQLNSYGLTPAQLKEAYHAAD